MTDQVRVPGQRGATTRVEHRMADGTASPHLVAAALIAAIADGIERRLDPGEQVAGGGPDRRTRVVLVHGKAAVAQVGDDAVSSADAQSAEPSREPRHVVGMQDGPSANSRPNFDTAGGRPPSECDRNRCAHVLTACDDTNQRRARLPRPFGAETTVTALVEQLRFDAHDGSDVHHPGVAHKVGDLGWVSSKQTKRSHNCAEHESCTQQACLAESTGNKQRAREQPRGNHGRRDVESDSAADPDRARERKQSEIDDL